MRLFLRTRCSLGLLILLLGTGSLHGNQLQREANRLKESGYNAFEIGHYGKAIAAFERSYAIWRNPKILYNLALAYLRRYELKSQVTDLRQAQRIFSRFLTLVPNQQGPSGKPIRRARAYAKRFLAEISRTIAAIPSRPTPSSQPTASGSAAVRPKKKPARRAAIEPADGGAQIGTWHHWLAYGLGAVSLGVALTTGILAKRADHRSDDQAAAGQSTAASNSASAARRLAVTTDIALGLGIASLVTGGVLHYRFLRRARRRIRIETMGLAGLQLSGAF